MNNRTLIDDLPSIDTINKKYIMNAHTPPPESGMSMSTPNLPPSPEYMEDNTMFNMPRYQYDQNLPPQASNHSLNCVDVSKHVKDCPVCQYYYHTNTLMYINVIGLFVIIFLILKYHK
jgi:hypothetical protein